MNNLTRPALDLFGQALLDYWQGNKSAILVHEYRTGQKKPLPVSIFFRTPEEFFPTENAFEHCRGRILDVGAGTGIHALELEKQGYAVTAMDICAQAVQIMRERGLKDVRQQDYLKFQGETFDTILMLGQNIGICETLSGLEGLLHKSRMLLKQGGQLLVNSTKEAEPPGGSNSKTYPGEQEFRFCYKGLTGPWMRWLHVDFNTLRSYAIKSGWSAEKLVDTEEGDFLARLKPDGSTAQL